MNTAIAHSFCKTTAQQTHKCYTFCSGKATQNQYEECLRMFSVIQRNAMLNLMRGTDILRSWSGKRRKKSDYGYCIHSILIQSIIYPTSASPTPKSLHSQSTPHTTKFPYPTHPPSSKCLRPKESPKTVAPNLPFLCQLRSAKGKL
jgi:hypothetical protein